MCLGQKLLQIRGIRSGLRERMIFELKEEKENVRKETEESTGAKTKVPERQRTGLSWALLEAGAPEARESLGAQQIGPGAGTCRWALLHGELQGPTRSYDFCLKFQGGLGGKA